MTRARLALVVLAIVSLTVACVPRAPSTPVAAPSTSVLRSRSIERHEKDITMRFRNTGCSNASTGSGFAVGPHDIVTNRHVAQDSLDLEVNSWDGSTYHVSSVELASNADLAIVHVQETLPAIATLRATQVPTGAKVTIAGYPRGNQLRFVDGTIASAMPGTSYNEPGQVEQLSGEVQPGNSGGPIFDDKGDVTGVVFAQVIATGNGLAISVDTLKAFLAGGGTPDKATC